MKLATIGLQFTLNQDMDESVTPGKTYAYRVRAVGARGAGAWSAEATLEAPAAPSPTLAAPTITMVMQMGGGLHIQWTAVGEGVTGFDLQRKVGDGDFTDRTSVGASVRSFMDMQPVPGSVNTYRVRAQSAAGPSEWSDPEGATP
jgi:hypothetical protein